MADICNRKYYIEKYTFKDIKALYFLWYNFYMLLSDFMVIYNCLADT